MNELQSLIDGARSAVGNIAFINDDGTVRGTYEKRAAHVENVSIRALEMPVFASNALRDVHVPKGTVAGVKSTLEHSVAAGSRCFEAGARLITVPAASKVYTAGNNTLAFEKRERRFDVIDAAPFTQVLDGHELGDSAIPVHRAVTDVDTMPQIGVRIPLSRSEQKKFLDGELVDTALVSIALGLARASDRILLAAIVASNPAVFNPALVAASGVKMQEIRGLVGTNGAAAGVAADGTLRVHWNCFENGAGVVSEFTPDMAPTIVGAFDRSAIAIFEEITLIADRVNVNSDLTLTCWAAMQALLPKPGVFWKGWE